MQVHLGDLEAAASSYMTKFFIILSKGRQKTKPLRAIYSSRARHSALPDRNKFVAIVPLLIFAAIEVPFF